MKNDHRSSDIWVKKLVYTVRVWMKDGTWDDYFTEDYNEIPTIKRRIMEENDPDEIEEITWDEDPQLHEFLNPERRSS